MSGRMHLSPQNSPAMPTAIFLQKTPPSRDTGVRRERVRDVDEHGAGTLSQSINQKKRTNDTKKQKGQMITT